MTAFLHKLHFDRTGTERWKPYSSPSANAGGVAFWAEEALLPYRRRCAIRQRELDDALNRLIAQAERTSDIARLVVFGSYATGNISPWSDLDVLVVRDGGPPDMVDDLYRESGAAGEIIGVRTADYPQRLRQSPFGAAILTSGREVYARPAR